jgi:hypothetical protein
MDFPQQKPSSYWGTPMTRDDPVEATTPQVGVYRRSVVTVIPMEPGPVTKGLIYHQQLGGLGGPGGLGHPKHG